MACWFSIIASGLFFFVDLFISKDYISLPLEVISIIIFFILLQLNKKIQNKVRLHIWFVASIIILTNIGWYTGGGFNIPNTSIFYLTGIAAIIILRGKVKNLFLIILLVDFIILSMVEYYHPELKYFHANMSHQNVTSNIFILITLILGAGVLSYFKNRYEEEREIIKDQVVQLDEKNQEITMQNEELIQQHEEILTQHDYIEENNRKLQEANEEISTINDTLEEQIKNRTVELEDLYKDLDMLFYRSSHDFRRPLTSLMGLSRIALMSLQDDESIELFQQVSSTARQMDRMLLKFFMLYQINHYHDFEPLAIDNILQISKDRLLNNGTDIQFEHDIQLQKFKKNDNRNRILEIILFNLIENSIMFCDKPKAQIICKILENNQHIHLTVEDNGIGIPERYKEKIFEIYFRGSLYSTGNGLGLYVTKKAVDRLGGKIKIESVIDHYTKFEVTFPINF